MGKSIKVEKTIKKWNSKNFLNPFDYEIYTNKNNEFEFETGKKRLNPLKSILIGSITTPILAYSLFINGGLKDDNITRNVITAQQNIKSINHKSEIDLITQKIKNKLKKEEQPNYKLTKTAKNPTIETKISPLVSNYSGDQFKVNNIIYNVPEYSNEKGNQFKRLLNQVDLPETGYIFDLEQTNKSGSNTIVDLSFDNLESKILELRKNKFDDIFTIKKKKHNIENFESNWYQNIPLTELDSKNKIKTNQNIIEKKEIIKHSKPTWDGIIYADLDSIPGNEKYFYDSKGFAKTFYDEKDNEVNDKYKNILFDIAKKGGYLK